jgi:predicted nucleic-acid-binding protein
MRAVDTNVLVRLIVRDDERQTAAAERFITGGAWVPLLVLAETVWVLSTVYGATARHIAVMVEMLLDHRDLVVQDAGTAAAAAALFRSKPALGFSACLVLEAARKAGHLPLGTFDRRLARAAGAQLL